MCITKDTLSDVVMSWYDHYCADTNTLILSFLPFWSYIILYYCFYHVEVIRMQVCFTHVKRIHFSAWFIWMLCYQPMYFIVFYVIYMLQLYMYIIYVISMIYMYIYIYHVLCQKWQNKSVKSINQVISPHILKRIYLLAHIMIKIKPCS